jgi:hypothetical protein
MHPILLVTAEQRLVTHSPFTDVRTMHKRYSSTQYLLALLQYYCSSSVFINLYVAIHSLGSVLAYMM